MTRWKRLPALILSLLLLCASCSKESSKAVEVDVPALMESMLTTAPIDDPLTLTESDMLDFYGIPAEHMTQFAATLCSNGISAQEIVLVETPDETTAAEVATRLQNRLEARMAESKDYLPDQYEIISGCEVVQNGCLVRLIIHPEAETLITLYQEKTGT